MKTTSKSKARRAMDRDVRNFQKVMLELDTKETLATLKAIKARILARIAG